MMRIWLSIAAIACVCAVSLLLPTPAHADFSWLQGHEDGSRRFQEITVNDEMVVYYHQRRIGDAVVELDQIVYQFDRRTGQLRDRKARWREDLPQSLPDGLLSREWALTRAGGAEPFVQLMYIDPESVVFPLVPAPANPCWVVRSTVDRSLQIDVFDAVTGAWLGQGVPPPYTGFSLTGPTGDNPCSGSWISWSDNARYWFESMGYPTEHVIWPDEATFQGHIQSLETAVFYELAHGGSTGFAYGCPDGDNYLFATPGKITGWIGTFTKLPFTFLGSCDGMCNYGPGTLSDAFRMGSFENTATVGYCGMSTPDCSSCWNRSLDWQDALFSYLAAGWTVRAAFDQANADYPVCLNNDCMRLAGDDNLALVPVLPRMEFDDQVFSDATNGALGDAGDCRSVAWVDFDGDGDLDLHVVNHGTADALLRNDGGDLFVNVATAPLADAGAGAGAAWADFDNDGDPDVYLTRDGQPNLLLRNDGEAVFTDVTVFPLNDAGPGRGAAWGDYNGDGLLDIYFVNQGAANVLATNIGDPGTGQWLFIPSGQMGHDGAGRVASWSDFDEDGDQDLYLVNNFEANVLFENLGSFGFSSVLTGTPIADTGGGMGLSRGDCNQDGRFDLYVANDGPTDVLLEDTGGYFVPLEHEDLGDVGLGRAAGWADFDNDGDLDLLLARHQDMDYLVQNDGGEQFSRRYGLIPMEYANSQCLAWCDYDGDGDLDLYIGRETGNKLLRNDLEGGNHWLQIDLQGTDCNRSAVGAVAELVTGETSQFRLVSAAGTPGQDSPTLAFGLGAATTVDSLVVTWPDGQVQTVMIDGVDQRLLVVQGEVSGVPVAGGPGRPRLVGSSPNPFNPKTNIIYELPAPGAVSLTVFDAAGNLVRRLQDGTVQRAGRHEVPWDGRDDSGRQLSSGVYLYVLNAGSFREAGKMALLR